MQAHDRHGNPIVAGPYVPSIAPCIWCGEQVTYDPDLDQDLNDAGQRCTPQARQARCVWEGVQRFGLIPQNYPGHHLFCSCLSDICHIPRTEGAPPYPYPDRLAWHCNEPARLTRREWVCRARHCQWRIPVGKPPPWLAGAGD